MSNRDLVIEYLDLSQPPQYSVMERKMLAELDNRPIVYDEDCPPLTTEQLMKYRRMAQQSPAKAANP
ncbi:MAG: hypothetical protein IJ812_10460 [Schwartzia sp.]|nr:hypothetical protein [Schwartzia sp. (in: firmicutes)]